MKQVLRKLQSVLIEYESRFIILWATWGTTSRKIVRHYKIISHCWLALSKEFASRQWNKKLNQFFFCQQDFTLDVYFRQYWKDERLSFTKQRGIDILTISTEFLRNMWVPDTFFANEKTAYLHMVTTSNEFVRIRHDGEITRSMRYVPMSHLNGLKHLEYLNESHFSIQKVFCFPIVFSFSQEAYIRAWWELIRLQHHG